MTFRLLTPGVIRFGRFLIGGILSLLVVEFGLRLIEGTPLWRILPVVQPILGQPDKEFGFESTPGAHGIWTTEHRARFQMNSLGLRDVERQLAKPAGIFRVGLLGDSMVEAAQVGQEATFGALAERRLRDDGYNVEVINLGMAGPSPIRQLWRLEKRGYQLGLDLIVANSSASSFLSGVLLDDSENPAYVDIGNGQLALGYGFRQRFSQRHADDLLGRVFVALYQNSPVFRMLYLRAKQPLPMLMGVPALQAGQRPVATPTIPDPEAARQACLAATAALEPMIRLWQDQRPQLLWAATARFLEDLAANARVHGVRVLYAIRDVPLAPVDCPQATSARASLLLNMDHRFTRLGMRLIDWSVAVSEIVGGPTNVPRLHGFGIHKGTGHLNFDGHRAWATALIKVLQPELPRRPDSTPEEPPSDPSHHH